MSLGSLNSVTTFIFFSVLGRKRECYDQIGFVKISYGFYEWATSRLAFILLLPIRFAAVRCTVFIAPFHRQKRDDNLGVEFQQYQVIKICLYRFYIDISIV